MEITLFAYPPGEEGERAIILPEGYTTKERLLDELRGLPGSTQIYFEHDCPDVQSKPLDYMDLLKGAIRYYPGCGSVVHTDDSETTTLTPNPNNIFKTLVAEPNVPHSREDLLSVLEKRNGFSPPKSSRTIDNHVRFIRQALKQHSSALSTIKGHGFVFIDT